MLLAKLALALQQVENNLDLEYIFGIFYSIKNLLERTLTYPSQPKGKPLVSLKSLERFSVSGTFHFGL